MKPAYLRFLAVLAGFAVGAAILAWLARNFGPLVVPIDPVGFDEDEDWQSSVGWRDPYILELVESP